MMGTHTHTTVVQCAESYSWKSWKVNTGPEWAAGGGDGFISTDYRKTRHALLFGYRGKHTQEKHMN